MVKDPVCGMDVDERKAKYSSEREGRKFYFCSAGCKERFDGARAEPAHPMHHGTHVSLASAGTGPEASYHCPMHPHITSRKPGRCPECGMKLEKTGGGASEHHAEGDFKRRFWISALLTLPILLLSPMIQEWAGLSRTLGFPGDVYVLFAFSTLIFLYGGFPFLQGLYYEVRSRNPGMMTLIGLATGVAYTYSTLVVFGVKGSIFYWELATLIDLMLLGHWIEMKSVMGASRALEELARLMPPVAHKVRADRTTDDVPLSELARGDRVVVKPAERIPADGVVVEGRTDVDESLLTGESKPVLKEPGSIVIGGSLAGDGSITVEITKTGSDSFISHVVRLVEEAQQSKSRTQDLANRAALWLTFIAVGAGGATLAVWLAATNAGFAFALERTVTVMVITCPHALGLAIPLVVAVSTSIAAGKGVLIRDRSAFENAREIQAIIFDKTGTLTKGSFQVSRVTAIGRASDTQELLDQAAAVESRSEHPIGKAITKSARSPLTVDGFKSTPGEGVEGRVNGRKVQVVSRGYFAGRGIPFPLNTAAESERAGETTVYLIIDDVLSATISLSDTLRPESKPAIAKLKRMGIRCIMLTGDNNESAKRIAEDAGIDEYFANVLPGEKALRVREIQSRGMVVGMVGDGVNDAPALAQADVGIAIGAGTEVAIETADIVLVKSNPLDVVTVIVLARATYRKMVQNLAWATGYNVFAIPLAAGVLYPLGILLSPALGAILMSVSTVVVAFNARVLGKAGAIRRFEMLRA